jgi:hypothetical protein
METSLAGWDMRNATSFQPVIQQLASNKSGYYGGSLVLKFVKQAGFGGRLGRGGLGGGQGIEDECGEGQLGRKWCGGEREK